MTGYPATLYPGPELTAPHPALQLPPSHTTEDITFAEAFTALANFEPSDSGGEAGEHHDTGDFKCIK